MQPHWSQSMVSCSHRVRGLSPGSTNRAAAGTVWVPPQPVHSSRRRSEERLAGLPERLAGPACLNLPVLQRAALVRTVEEAEVLPGIRLLHAPGHTPGHMAVAITSGRYGATYAR
jgi:glyoxylase-like metal-dependent hydrolase (beta-lactamase superfamily II)